MKLDYYAATDIGKKYTHNEDFYITPGSLDTKQQDNIPPLFVLCDGIGGRNAGEVASKLTAQWLQKDFIFKTAQNGKENDLNNIQGLKQEISDIIVDINLRILNLSKEHEQYRGMGTTVLTAFFSKESVVINSVGDSRCYLLRDKALQQITDDHSEVWELYKIGALSKDDIIGHPRGNIITMAVGAFENIKINSYSFQHRKGDLLLMTSDGLTDLVYDTQIEKTLNSKTTLQTKAESLIDMANDAGGKDNITVILIQL